MKVGLLLKAKPVKSFLPLTTAILSKKTLEYKLIEFIGYSDRETRGNRE
jgi:hypothetical protein